MNTAEALARLSVEEKAAQMIMIDLPGLELSDRDRAHLASHAWNGVILFAKNVSTRDQVVRLVESIHDAAPQPALIAVDQELSLIHI